MNKLTAVNRVLTAIQETRVSSLEDALPDEVGLVVQKIDEIDTNLQSQGWWFNRTYNRTFPLDSENEIPVPAEVLKITTNRFQGWRDFPVLRNRRLYNSTKNSWTWTAPVTLYEVVEKVPWDCLPHQAQEYITRRACREMAAELGVGTTETQNAAFNEADSMNDLIHEENQQERPNMLTGVDFIDVLHRTHLGDA